MNRWAALALTVALSPLGTACGATADRASTTGSTAQARATATRTSGTGTATSSRSTTTSPRATSTRSTSGIPACAADALPRQAQDTIDAIHAGPPYPYPRNDGVTFGNRERHLPPAERGYYREYTVVTPGASTRGTRRIITGGDPKTDPPQWFYTGDHYDSFCSFTPS